MPNDKKRIVRTIQNIEKDIDSAGEVSLKRVGAMEQSYKSMSTAISGYTEIVQQSIGLRNELIKRLKDKPKKQD